MCKPRNGCILIVSPTSLTNHSEKTGCDTPQILAFCISLVPTIIPDKSAGLGGIITNGNSNPDVAALIFYVSFLCKDIFGNLGEF